MGDLFTLEYGKPVNDKESLDGPVPVFGTNGQIGTSHLPPLCGHPSVILGRKGAYRGVHFSDRPFSVIDTAFYVEPISDAFDIKWLYYKLLTYDINNMDSGSAIPSTDRYQIYSLPIEVPPINAQREMVHVLDSLNDKIALNTRINHNLEEQAQALYKSWFIDFEPFKDGKFVDSELGMIPEGWSIKKVGELPLFIADYVANGSFASLKENVTLSEQEDYAIFVRNTDLKSGNFGVYVNRASYDFLAKTRLFGGEIIVSNVGDVGSVHLCPGLNYPMTLGNNVIMIRPVDNCYSAFLYLNLKYFSGHHSIEGITGGSAMPKFNKTDFKSIKMLVPPESVLTQFASIENPLFTDIEMSRQEVRKLCTIRDTLLPAMMDGTLPDQTINC